VLFFQRVEKMTLAIFDLDNTLIDGDSDYEWGQFLVSKKLVDEKEYDVANKYFYDEYKKGTLDIIEYAAFSYKPLAIRSMQELAELHQEFMQAVILPIIKPQSKPLIKKHSDKGDTLMIITATNTFITGPIAKHFGIDHLIGIEPKIVNGRYTTEVDGTPSFQEGKVVRLNEWLKKHNETTEGSVFYSDSHNDMSLLEIVDTPIAVDPDEELKEIAEERNWEIISLK